MSSIITEITAKVGEEECKVDVEKLHEILLALPAEKYIELYHEMKSRIEGVLFYIDSKQKFQKVSLDHSNDAMARARL